MGTAFDYFSHKSSGVLKVVAISRTSIRKFLLYYLSARIILTNLTLVVLALLNLWGVLVFSFLSSVVSCLIGIICGNIGTSAGSVASISNILLILLLATCGLFYSLDALPTWLSAVFSFSPFEMLAEHAYSLSARPVVIAYNFVLIGILLLGCVFTFKYE